MVETAVYDACFYVAKVVDYYEIICGYCNVLYNLFMTTFSFTTEHPPKRVTKVIDMLRGPRLWIPTEHDYPNHDRWLAETEAQIASGAKRAIRRLVR